MVQKKFRGVRQRHWGSWVSEIRHPLLKRRVWLGTFESAEEAAKAYDEASVLMNGRNAKTNFPVIPRTVAGEAMPGKSSPPTGLSVLLREKLRRCCKVQSPSLTCLRLDPEKYSYIGVWQKGAGAQSESNWIMRVELGKKTAQVMSSTESSSAALPSETGSSTSAAAGAGGGLKEEEKIALQMIEELLNSPSPL